MNKKMMDMMKKKKESAKPMGKRKEGMKPKKKG